MVSGRAEWEPNGWCPVCGQHFIRRWGGGRRRVYCNDACRQRAYRQRIADRQAAVIQTAISMPAARPGFFGRLCDWLGV